MTRAMARSCFDIVVGLRASDQPFTIEVKHLGHFPLSRASVVNDQAVHFEIRLRAPNRNLRFRSQVAVQSKVLLAEPLQQFAIPPFESKQRRWARAKAARWEAHLDIGPIPARRQAIAHVRIGAHSVRRVTGATPSPHVQ